MKRYIFLVLTTLILNNNIYAEDKTSRLEDVLARLDSAIVQRDNYVKQKEQIIDGLRMKLATVATDQERFATSHDIFLQYKSFKYDSAYVYANRMMDYARKTGNAQNIARAQQSLMVCLYCSGLFKEAYETSLEINPALFRSQADRLDIYRSLALLNFNLADYASNTPFEEEYLRRGRCCTDSMMANVKPESGEWLFAKGFGLMKGRDYENGSKVLAKVLTSSNVSSETRAMTASCLGWIAYNAGNVEQAIDYFVTSAVIDIEQATKETTAMRDLGKLLYERGEVDRGLRYVQIALDDANFYNARQRKLELGGILPVIEEDRYRSIASQRNLLIGCVSLAALLALVLLAAYIIIYRQNKKLYNATSEIKNKGKQLEEVNSRLEQKNEELQQKNEVLRESQKIKEEYIGNSFYTNAEFIEKMERLYRTIDRKITAHQYDDIRKAVRENNANDERDSMYAAFDATFIKLFPTFVEDYNALFLPEDHKLPAKGQMLTPEMRIFAIMRLGITSSEKIGRFLNYSVHTINTYKTRVKNKSVISNEEFEDRIMQIGVR